MHIIKFRGVSDETALGSLSVKAIKTLNIPKCIKYVPPTLPEISCQQMWIAFQNALVNDWYSVNLIFQDIGSELPEGHIFFRPIVNISNSRFLHLLSPIILFIRLIIFILLIKGNYEIWGIATHPRFQLTGSGEGLQSNFLIFLSCNVTIVARLKGVIATWN